MKEFIKNLRRRRFKRSRRRGFAFVAPVLLALFLSAGVCVVRAQDENANAAKPEVQRELEARGRGANAAGLLRILNLTPEQRAQIGAIRRETEPQNRLLGARLREARRALDEAIYAATPDENVIEERLREVGEAQAAVVRLRSLTELRIRRVLSPEQLDAFRRLQNQTRRRRDPNRLPGQRGDAPPRFGDRRRRRAEERQMRRRAEEQRQQQQQQQQQRLPAEQNAPPAAAPPAAAPRERRPAAPARDRRP